MSSDSSMPLVGANQWLSAAAHRRSIYGLKGTSVITDERVTEIIRVVQSFSPSAYNSQPLRFTLVTKAKHKQMWDVILQAAEPVLRNAGSSVWDTMKAAMEGHKAAYGTVIFWESGEAQQQAAAAHKSSVPLLPQFGDHASGMAQLLVWTALELEGLGANLQHLQSMASVETAMKLFCGVPDDYSLKAQLNFGDKSYPHPDVPPKITFAEAFNAC